MRRAPRPVPKDYLGLLDTKLRIERKLNQPISLEMLREDETLANWDLVRGNMRHAIKLQSSSILDTPRVWNAFRNLCLRHNPDLIDVIPPSGPYVVHFDNAINDASGNNNGLMDTGE